MDLMLVKLGGSVITEKDKLLTYREDVASRLVSEIAQGLEEGPYDGVIVVHGAGSFGHISAKEGKLSEGAEEEWQIPYVSRVQRDCRELNLHILNAMLDAGLKPVSLPPSAMCWKEKPSIDDHNGFVMDLNIVRHYIDRGFVPVTFGDVVPDREKAFSILSGDDLMLKFSATLPVRRAVFVSNVDGVYSYYPGGRMYTTFTRESLAEMIALEEKMKASKSGNVDVTGSMRRKCEMALKIAGHGVECGIINGLAPNLLKESFTGGKPGTWFLDDGQP